MATVLFVSLTLLVLTLGIRHYELARGGSRAFELTRTRLDRSTLKFSKKAKTSISHFFDYTKKDVFLNFLHMVTYTALHVVRFLETKLEKSIKALRAFKKSDIASQRKPRKRIVRKSEVTQDDVFRVE